MGPLESAIRTKIEAIQPKLYELENESRNHGFSRGPEGHFKLKVVSTAFEGLSKIERHQKVFAILSTEMQSGVHALSLRLQTPQEADRDGGTFQSPPCAHGSKQSESAQ